MNAQINVYAESHDSLCDLSYCCYVDKVGRAKCGYLLNRTAVNDQTSLSIRTVSSEP